MEDKKIQIIKDDEIDIRALIELIWPKRKQILKITLVFTFIGVLYALFATPLYKSTISLYPSNSESNSAFSQLKGVAATFGYEMGGIQTAFNIPDIIKSRRLKTQIFNNKWKTSKFINEVDLITYWELNYNEGFSISLNPIKWVKSLISFLKGEGEKNEKLIWEETALEIINKRISILENKSGLVVVNVLMEEPKLSADIANFIYNAIVDYTGTVHNAQARLNREFIEKRQVEVESELIRSEEKLKQFRERNRSIIESPKLQMELEQLMRDVQIQTEVYITLQQQYELARIEEVKETPSVVILDEGKPSVEKDKPKRKLIVLISMVLGCIISFGTVIIRDSIKKYKINL